MTDVTGTITYPPLERYEFTFIVPPDPRDARIAELEALIDGYKNLNRVNNVVVGKKDMRIAELEAALAGAVAAGRGLSAVCEAWEKRAIVYDARIAEFEAQLAAYHDNPLKRIVMIDGAWIGQSFGDLDAQATEYQARIAELEAALRAIESEALRAAGTKWEKLAIIQDIAAYALMPPSERDMAITQEEVGA